MSQTVTDQRCTSPPSITRMRARTACVNILRNQLRPSAARLTTTFSGRRIFAKFDSCVDRPRDYLIMQSSYCTAARCLQIARVGCTAAAVFWLFAPLVVVSVNRDRRGLSKAAGEWMLKLNRWKFSRRVNRTARFWRCGLGCRSSSYWWVRVRVCVWPNLMWMHRRALTPRAGGGGGGNGRTMRAGRRAGRPGQTSERPVWSTRALRGSLTAFSALTTNAPHNARARCSIQRGASQNDVDGRTIVA